MLEILAVDCLTNDSNPVLLLEEASALCGAWKPWSFSNVLSVNEA